MTFGGGPSGPAISVKSASSVNEYEFVRLSIVPDRAIVRTLQSEQAHVARTRKQIIQLSAKLEA